MKAEECIAKSSNGETIKQHTDNLLKAYNELFSMYGNNFDDVTKDLIKDACKYHDMGKSNYEFQKLMLKKKKEKFIDNNISKEENNLIEKEYSEQKFSYIPHGCFSPAFIDYKCFQEKYGEDKLKLLLNVIFHHHNRDVLSVLEIKQAVTKLIASDLKIRFKDEIYGTRNSFKKIDISRIDTIPDKEWIDFAIVMGMLNKFDYYASSNTTAPIEIPVECNGKNIAKTVEEKMFEKRYVKNELQEYMQKNNDKNVIVIASTGMGKTEGALLWANDSKTFYTLPLKVSINAIYERIKKEYAYENVTLLHSDTLAYLIGEDEEKGKNNIKVKKDEEDEDAFTKYKITRSFSYPLTVCTVDQLFTFVYKYRGCEQILATLKYSKLVIDEIQAYSPEIVARIIYGISLITQVGGKFAIITATLPPIFEQFLKEILNENKIEYLPQKTFYLDKKRHYICFKDDKEFDYDFIAEMGKTKKVLVICNTVARAQTVYSKLSENENVHLLHSHFIKKDRDLLEKAILKFSDEKGGQGIWISTQIVEASLDIDFDMLFTEMCPADNLLQRLGRCYRKRNYTANKPNIYIYNTENGRKTIYNQTIYDRSVEILQKYNNKLITEQEKIQYINEVYSVDAKENDEFKKQIKNEIDICKTLIPSIINKSTAKKKFRNISAVSVIPEKIYNDKAYKDKIDEAIVIINNDKSKKIDYAKSENYLNSLTMSLQENSKLVKDGADNGYLVLNKNCQIKRIVRKYDFNQGTLSGMGLLNEPDDECMMF